MQWWVEKATWASHCLQVDSQNERLMSLCYLSIVRQERGPSRLMGYCCIAKRVQVLDTDTIWQDWMPVSVLER
jgi:hypothetical protein